jgi:hypothetical protein
MEQRVNSFQPQDSGAKAPTELRVSISYCLKAGLVGVAVLVALHLARAYLVFGLGYNPLGLDKFDLNAEQSFVTWFSSTILLIGGVLAILTGWVERQARAPYWIMWVILGAIFVGMSADEVAGLHEISGKYLKQHTDWSGVLYYRWVVIGAVFAGAVGLFYLRFLLWLDARTRFLLLLAAALYLGGTLGIEVIGAVREEEIGSRANDLVYTLLVVVEETLEMTGSIVFAVALLDRLRRTTSGAYLILDR